MLMKVILIEASGDQVSTCLTMNNHDGSSCQGFPRPSTCWWLVGYSVTQYFRYKYTLIFSIFIILLNPYKRTRLRTSVKNQESKVLILYSILFYSIVHERDLDHHVIIVFWSLDASLAVTVPFSKSYKNCSKSSFFLWWRVFRDHAVRPAFV